MSPQFVLVLLLLAITCHAHVLFSRSLGCTISTRPCRLRVTAHNFSGSSVGTFSTSTCSCSLDQDECSEDWSDPRVISRNLLSGTYNMTIQMMFCVRNNLRQCANAEIALVVSSSLLLPTNLVSQPCQCSVALPLMLKRSWRGHDFLNYHSYVCNNDMPVCSGVNAQCADIEDGDATYSCVCPPGLTCRSNEAEEPHAPFHTGVCSL
ncbi:unnamed protein product [Lymnaea stagnalis]|uniref:EGF-like domain-containing protein n=1 Tax=Lymnaea stagnalis TaxID=6523 RepID=A0AAV2HQJ0_LYMST